LDGQLVILFLFAEMENYAFLRVKANILLYVCLHSLQFDELHVFPSGKF